MVTTVVPFYNARQDDVSASKWNIFSLQRGILLSFGCWPPDRSTRPWYIKVLTAINLVTLALCITGELLHALYAYRSGNLSEAIESICPTVARLSGFLRVSFILINERKIEYILNTINNIIQNEHPRESSDTARLMLLGQQFTRTILNASIGTATLYGVIPYFIMAYNWYQGQSPVVKLLPFKIVLPFDSQDPLLFTLTTIFLNYASIPTVTSMMADNALFGGICLYINGQFQAIKLELDAVAVTLDTTCRKGSASETRRINYELRRICRRHQEIIDLVAKTRTSFAPNILVVYICGAIMICIVSIAVFIAEGIYKLTYIPYTTTILLLLFLFSYGGTIIFDSSAAVQTMAYDFPWYRFDRNTRHLIQMMMIRARRGCNVDVPFFTTSLATFSVIVRSALSYITLMKSFL